MLYVFIAYPQYFWYCYHIRHRSLKLQRQRYPSDPGGFLAKTDIVHSDCIMCLGPHQGAYTTLPDPHSCYNFISVLQTSIIFGGRDHVVHLSLSYLYVACVCAHCLRIEVWGSDCCITWVIHYVIVISKPGSHVLQGSATKCTTTECLHCWLYDV